MLFMPFIQVVVHYYARLAAKQGWRFDSTYEHKDDTGDAVPFEFVVGSSEVCNQAYNSPKQHVSLDPL